MVATKTRSKQRTGSAALLKALGHPLRAKALTILTERVASPNELAKELGEGLSQVSYHVKVLREANCIELVKTEPRRGAVEHYYKSSQRPHLDTSEWSQLDQQVREAFSGYIVELLIGDTTRAFRDGTLDRRENSHLSRTPLSLDAEGFAELSAALDVALEAALGAEAASAARMTKSGEPAIATVAGLLAFEVPPSKGRKKVR